MHENLSEISGADKLELRLRGAENPSLRRVFRQKIEALFRQSSFRFIFVFDLFPAVFSRSVVRSEEPEVGIAADPKRIPVADAVVLAGALEPGDFDHAAPVLDAFRERLVDRRELVAVTASYCVELDQMRHV